MKISHLKILEFPFVLIFQAESFQNFCHIFQFVEFYNFWYLCSSRIINVMPLQCIWVWNVQIKAFILPFENWYRGNFSAIKTWFKISKCDECKIKATLAFWLIWWIVKVVGCTHPNICGLIKEPHSPILLIQSPATYPSSPNRSPFLKIGRPTENLRKRHKTHQKTVHYLALVLGPHCPCQDYEI